MIPVQPTAPYEAAAEGIFASMSMPDHYVAAPEDELSDASDVATQRRPRRFTPPSQRPPRVSDEVSRLLQEGPAHTFAAPADFADIFGLDYIHSDLPDRAILPFKAGGYSAAELEDELVNRGPRTAARREALEARKRQFVEEELTAAVNGPGSRIVVPHFGGTIGTFGTDHFDGIAGGPAILPDGTRYAMTRIAYPVAHGYTTFKVARTVAREAYGCWWDCDYHDLCSVMMVNTGGSLRLFATCERHRREFGPGPDYYRHDRWDEQHGYPAECRR